MPHEHPLQAASRGAVEWEHNNNINIQLYLRHVILGLSRVGRDYGRPVAREPGADFVTGREAGACVRAMVRCERGARRAHKATRGQSGCVSDWDACGRAPA